MAQDLSLLADELRRAGGDSASVEVKAAAGGLPDSLTPSLSALANLPGGGTIILGLDERNGFRPVSLASPQALKQGLAGRARGFEPPVVVEISDGTVDGAPVIVAQVHECDPSAKPAHARPQSWRPRPGCPPIPSAVVFVPCASGASSASMEDEAGKPPINESEPEPSLVRTGNAPRPR